MFEALKRRLTDRSPDSEGRESKSGEMNGGGAEFSVRDSFWRSLQTFTVTRVVMTILLLAYLNYSPDRDARSLDAMVSREGEILYLALALFFTILSFHVRRRFMAQLLSQVTVDIAVISKLYLAAGGASSGLAILYLFPLAGSAILAPASLALFVVSVVALILLGESVYQLLHTASPVSISQAGLYGGAFFAAAYTINRLAARLIHQEDLALRRGRDLQLQQAINRLVVADMADGVLVVGGDTEVYACNPAAGRMLDIPHNALPELRLADLPALQPLAAAYREWKSEGARPTSRAATTYVTTKTDGEATEGEDGSTAPQKRLAKHLQLRFARVDTTDPEQERAVIFVRDVSEIENQAQQLKLASMGRLTASIAHEVRNPLSAVSHAASLLQEEVNDRTQQRLLSIVAENVSRLDHMIEDILKLSRKAHVQGSPLALRPFIEEIAEEFRERNRLPSGCIALSDLESCKVRFDPLHLREVVVNLLSNAPRYASGSRGAIRVYCRQPKPGRLELHIQDDGPPITPEVRAHLFEPFYTTSSKGTGLGLYVARELCLNNGAMLDYEFRADGQDGELTGRFVVTFALDGI